MAVSKNVLQQESTAGRTGRVAGEEVIERAEDHRTEGTEGRHEGRLHTSIGNA